MSSANQPKSFFDNVQKMQINQAIEWATQHLPADTYTETIFIWDVLGSPEHIPYDFDAENQYGSGSFCPEDYYIEKIYGELRITAVPLIDTDVDMDFPESEDVYKNPELMKTIPMHKALLTIYLR